jgi:hypothetical protein
MRRNALQEWGEEYLTHSKSILNRIKSLQYYCHWEHNKVLKKKSGSSTDEMYTSSCILILNTYLNHVLFLKFNILYLCICSKTSLMFWRIYPS